MGVPLKQASGGPNKTKFIIWFLKFMLYSRNIIIVEYKFN